MSEKDLYEDLCRYYEFMLGKIPHKEQFKGAIQQTVSREELTLFFQVPFAGNIGLAKLEKKAIKLGISPGRLHEMLKRLCVEGFLMSYGTPAGRAYERGNPAFMSEQQVRKQEDTPRRRAYAEFMDALIEGAASAVPNKTPYYRVLPVEGALKGKIRHGEVEINVIIPDPRRVLPLDEVSKMVRHEQLMGVAECYCRKARRVVGKDCGHPLETCMVFDTIAQTLIEAGIARPIDQTEALRILRDSEAAGLVHNVDNCEGHIKSICNCCACSCVVLKTVGRGQTNAGAPSRFQVALEPEKCQLKGACVQVCPSGTLRMDDHKLSISIEKCLGCGQCVRVCPEGALHLENREKVGKIYRSNDELWGKIRQEAILGIAVNKILGK